jgi:hypothetical protein
MGVKVQGHKIYLPKLGWMRFYNSRPIPNGFTIKTATIRKRQDGWYSDVLRIPVPSGRGVSNINCIIPHNRCLLRTYAKYLSNSDFSVFSA